MCHVSNRTDNCVTNVNDRADVNCGADSQLKNESCGAENKKQSDGAGERENVSSNADDGVGDNQWREAGDRLVDTDGEDCIQTNTVIAQASQLVALVNQKLQHDNTKLIIEREENSVLREMLDENALQEEDIKNICDFRAMAKKMKSSRKEGVKRLQEGPKRARQAVAQRTMTGKMLRKLVDKLANEIPEMKIGEEVRRIQRMERRPMTPSQRKTTSIQ